MQAGKKSSSRLAFLDWTRGIGALIMLQGHVFHSFARPDQRNTGAFVLSQFAGGLPPAIFLFLTGVTYAFLMDSQERKATPYLGRVTGALRRAGYLLLLAVLFRVQLFLFAWPQSHWSSLLRVDILNCMALSLAALVPLVFYSTVERIRGGAILGFGIAALSPLVSMLPAGFAPDSLRHYFVPDPNFFSFFPWAAFVAFGVSAGSILRVAPADRMHRLMPWAAWMGIVLIVGAQYFSNLPYSLYPNSDFWLNSPGLILIKLGVILLLASFAWIWTQHAKGWSWVRQLGTTSLLVYWVHTELVYGRWFGGWKESLGVAETAVSAAVVVALMVALSTAKTRWREWAPNFSWLPQPAPQRVSGD